MLTVIGLWVTLSLVFGCGFCLGATMATRAREDRERDAEG